jgi:hypothetical protein
MYISDTGNNQVIKLNLASSKTEVIVKVPSPMGIDFDEEQRNLYIVSGNANSIVARYNLKSQYIEKVAGDYNRGANRQTLENLYDPSGLYIDRDENIYVAESSSARITKWWKKQKSGQQVAGNSPSIVLYQPTSILLDDQDTMYITDMYLNQTLRWTKDATTGQCILGCRNRIINGSRIKIELTRPYDLTFDSQFNIFIVERDMHRIKRFNVHYELSCSKTFFLSKTNNN